MRDVVVLYFSGTGNTRYLSEKISNAFRRRRYQVDLVSIEDQQALRSLKLEGKLVGIGFPCYALTYPRIIGRAIRELPRCVTAVPAFIFATKGWCAGDSMKKLAGLIRANNFYTIQTGSFICPNNGWITLFSPQSFLCRKMGYENGLSGKIAEFVDSVLDSLVRYDSKQYCVNTSGNPVFSFLAWCLGKLESVVMQNYRVDHAKCLRCGLCIRNCPDRNIRLAETGGVTFRNPSRCLWCLRCISNCPAGAIELGRLLAGKGWYTEELRMEYRRKINDYK